MTTLKSLVAAALLSVFAAGAFAQAPVVAPLGSHHAVERKPARHHRHHHHHHHHAPVRR